MPSNAARRWPLETESDVEGAVEAQAEVGVTGGPRRDPQTGRDVRVEVTHRLELVEAIIGHQCAWCGEWLERPPGMTARSPISHGLCDGCQGRLARKGAYG